MLSIVRILAVVSAGLYAGIIFGDRLGASYARPLLDASGFVLFQQIQHLHFKPVLMPLTLIAVTAGPLWVAMSSSRRRQPEFWLAAAGAAAMLGPRFKNRGHVCTTTPIPQEGELATRLRYIRQPVGSLNEMAS